MLGSPKVQLNTPQQSKDWRSFYTKAINYLETLNIDATESNDNKTSWKQLKIVFRGEDRQLINNETITPESQKVPQSVLDTIMTTIKSEDPLWNFWDELLLDVHQLPDEAIHALSTQITALINHWKFSNDDTKKALKIMVLQHVVRYHKAWDWIWLQDQSQLTYKALLTHCQLLESQWKQYQKAKEKGQADFTSLSTVTSSASFFHQDAPQPSLSAISVATPTPRQVSGSWQSATTTMAGTTALPCVDKTEDSITPPMTAEPDHPDNQADWPREVAGSDTTNLAPGADQVAPLAGTPAIPRA